MAYYSGVSRQEITIPAYGMETLYFKDTKPNYFGIQNQGSGAVYFGISHIPTMYNYDVKIPGGGGYKLYTEPFPKSACYLFNSSGSPATVKVISFAADFDPLALAMQQLEINITNTPSFSGTIAGFTCELPAGDNEIGSVSIKAADLTTLTNAIADNCNAINSVIKTNDRSWTESFDTSGGTALDYNPATGYVVHEIVFVSNDSNADKVFTWYDLADGQDHTLTLKPGEAISNMIVNARSVEYPAGAGRAVFTVKVVV